MVAVSVGAPKPRPGRALPALLLAGLTALAAFAVPVASDHLQTDAARSIQFDHRGGNEWWVEAMLGGRDAGSVMKVEAMDDGGPWTPLTKRSWGAWAASFHVEPGHRVLFRATWGDGLQRTSCWFEHPSGVERCDSTPPSGFDAHFTGVRGNEWWVQANVAANGPIARVDVTLGTSGTWQSLAKQSWGGWAASYHVPDGTVVRLRATAADGQSDLSSCRQWIPPSGQDAAVVPCPGSGAFDATFSGVKGNEWWVQANVAGNQPIAGVAVRLNCEPQWRPMELQSWGGWTASFHIPSGSKVDFQARSGSGTGAVDASGGYTWPSASATSGCALGAWPKDGSTAVYQLWGGVCGGGECMNSAATLTLTYQRHQWTGVCQGTDTHSLPDGSAVTGHWTQRLDARPLFERPATQVGGQHQVGEFVTFFQRGCAADPGYLQTVTGQGDHPTALTDANGQQVTLRAWTAERDVEQENRFVSHWDTKLGMVLDHASHPRRSQQGSWSTQLVQTDAPLR